jgi:hypothetical protein
MPLQPYQIPPDALTGRSGGSRPRQMDLTDLLGEFELPGSPASFDPEPIGNEGTPSPTEITPPRQPDIYTAQAAPGANLGQLMAPPPRMPPGRWPAPAQPPLPPGQNTPPGATLLEILSQLGNKAATAPLGAMTGNPQDTQTIGGIKGFFPLSDPEALMRRGQQR